MVREHLSKGAALTVLSLLTACGGASDDTAAALPPPLLPPGGVLIEYLTGGGANDCRPVRRDTADVGTSGLLSVRGEIIFQSRTGQTRAPLKTDYSTLTATGFAEDRETSALRSTGACPTIEIKIEVKSCVYKTEDGSVDGACPTIVASGRSNFADIKIVRRDT
ncbi:MAG: hypothetical protein AAGG79_05145 [Pseudomonadota bacterium]